jgi:hypothetical protein
MANGGGLLTNGWNRWKERLSSGWSGTLQVARDE